MRTLRPIPRSRCVSRFDAVARPPLRASIGGARLKPRHASRAPLVYIGSPREDAGAWSLQGQARGPPTVPRWEPPLMADRTATTLCEAGRRTRPVLQFFTESLILAQDERWRRA